MVTFVVHNFVYGTKP